MDIYVVFINIYHMLIYKLNIFSSSNTKEATMGCASKRKKKMNDVPFGFVGIFRVREIIDRYENTNHRRRQKVSTVKQNTRRKGIKNPLG